MADPPAEKPDYRHDRWSKHLEEIDREIAQLAVICKIALLDDGVIERVLKNDALVCGSENPRAFAKLRQLLMMHYSVREQAVVTLGEAETLVLVKEIVERLRGRFGDKLGGPAGV